MSAIDKIKNAGFAQTLVGGNLQISPASKLTAEQLAYIKAHKAEIVKALAINDAKPEPAADDRHYCRDCLNLRNGYCIRQRFRPVDDLPRRCDNFAY